MFENCRPQTLQIAAQCQQPEGKYCPPHLYRQICQLLSQCFPAQEREKHRHTAHGTLWFYLRDHGKDQRKRDGELTSTLEAQVCKLQEKIATKSGSRKTTALVSVA